MILIGFFANVVKSPSLTAASEQIKSFDSFGKANSFSAFGKYVLLAFLDSFLNLKIIGSEETRSELKIFVDDRDVSSKDFF